MTDTFDLDLSSEIFKPRPIRVKVSEDKVIEVDSDFHPFLIAQAHAWLVKATDAAGDPEGVEINWEEGWRIAIALCNDDSEVRAIGWRGMMRMLAFFRDTAWASLSTTSSSSPSELDEPSKEVSSSETSSEAPVSSVLPPTS